MLSVASTAGFAAHCHRFPIVDQISRGNRRGESSWQNTPVRKSTGRAAKTGCRGSESCNCRVAVFDCRLLQKQDFGGTVGSLSNDVPEFRIAKRFSRAFLQNEKAA